jgi:pyrimidine-nucleoside phosphorylase
MYIVAELIKKKRDGLELSADEIDFLIQSFTQGKIPDYQMSAWLMAVFLKGMNDSETLSLTQSMLNSGEVVDLSDVKRFKVDKHSIGGVGDKTSMILGPIVAASGIAVPMIAGRGLGHTGGTLDKLESIPGFRTDLSMKQFHQAIVEHNFCLIGQTKEICPADKKIYALRDVTATIESTPLICASIMSKKLAEGIDGLVLDVKYGSGSFMQSKESCENLAVNLMKIARGHGKKVTSLLTNMDQPLGQFAGNSLEIFECVEILKGKRSRLYDETRELSLQLSAHMMFLSGNWKTVDSAYVEAEKILTSGKAMDKFLELCKIHGGRLNELPTAKNKVIIKAKQMGVVQAFNTEQIGMVGVRIHAGREKAEDKIEPTAGVEFHCKVGDQVQSGEPLFTLYGAQLDLLNQAAPYLEKTITLAEKKIAKQDLIWKVLQ